ncbi:MAG: wax ester/triacylglycerol synthase family O-acyltransferase [Betaproteobacteria bacterium]|nr:wax ester/triacylglycerol synthase family O-acyltransferase [Betaproteobacteria bacterium]
MHPLSALDALFLHIETPETPMHVGSLMILKRPPRLKGSLFPKFRKLIANRMHLAPLFSRRLAFVPLDLANPVWLENLPVDLDQHVFHKKLPKPGTQAQLEAMVARLHEAPLDRDKPMWEFTLIEGLADGNAAMYAKIHHAALDGQGGVALAQAILDTDAKGRDIRAESSAKTSLTPTTAKLLSNALMNSVAQYGKIIGAVPGALKTLGMAGAALLSSSQAKKAGAPSEQGTGIPILPDIKPGDSPEKAAKSLLKKIPGGIALGPRTPLNVAIGTQRGFAGVRISLAETKALAKHRDAKLNDIVMAQCAGALRRYFAKQPAALAKSMVAGIPVSLRTPGDTSQSNQVTMMLVSLGTHLADEKKRFAAMRKSSEKAKMLTGSMKSVVPTDLPSLGIPWIMSIVTPLYKMAVETNRIPVIANLVISNVPGPQMALYVAGAEILEYYPVSIVSHGLALNITIQSYNGSLDYGFIACKKAIPKVEQFAKYLQAEHVGMMKAMEKDLAKAKNQETPKASVKSSIATTKKAIRKRP